MNRELILEFKADKWGQDPVSCGPCNELILILNNASLTADGSGILVVQIDEVTYTTNNYYVYKTHYDDAVLANPDVPLRACNVREACCKGCQIEYVEKLIAEIADCCNPNPLCGLEFQSSGTINFKDCGDCLRIISAEVAIVPDGGSSEDNNNNIIQATLNGLDTNWEKIGWVPDASQTHPEFAFMGSRAVIRAIAGSTDTYIQICGGNSEDSNTGATLGLYSKDQLSRPGDAEITLGDNAGSGLSLGRGGSATSFVAVYGGTAEQWRTKAGFLLEITNSAIESTGAGIPLPGANCPAVTLTAPYKWAKVITEDGSTGYIAVYK